MKIALHFIELVVQIPQEGTDEPLIVPLSTEMKIGAVRLFFHNLIDKPEDKFD